MNTIDVEKRKVVKSKNISILSDIYQEDVNMTVWQRPIHEKLGIDVNKLVQKEPEFKHIQIIDLNDREKQISKLFQNPKIYQDLLADVSQLVDVFCCLFDLTQVGLRFTTLKRSMCPKFHVDKIPCRLITTYKGNATEYLEKTTLSEQKSLYKSKDIGKLEKGDVALLKGESWPKNENYGIVHRSPGVLQNETRLILTLDFAS